MPPSVTISNLVLRFVVGCCVGWCLIFNPGSVWGRVLLNQDQALALAFPSGERVQRKTLYLTEAQKMKIEQLARSKVDSSLFTYYVGVGSSGVQGMAFFSTNIVRTMPETLMCVVNPDGSLRFVEILAFHEPEDYLPPKRWLALFEGKKLSDDLWVKRDIRNITGATLSSHSITEIVRKTLALVEVCNLKGQ